MSGIVLASVGNSYGAIPINTGSPAVSGAVSIGSSLSCSTGTWTGAPAPAFTYQWQRGSSNISGATSSSYTIVASDVGSTLRCVVTATNSLGVVSVTTASTAAVSGVWYGSRGVFGGGLLNNSTYHGTSYITIASTGNATAFGNLSVGRRSLSAVSSTSGRGVFGGGNSLSNVMDYITIASTGNATDFGNLTVGRDWLAGLSNGIRGVFGGGSYTNTMDYITIASTGNAYDFGDLTVSGSYLGGCSGETRGVFGGHSGGVMDYITIASTGNATDFGDLSAHGSGIAALSSTTRGVFGGGYSGGFVNTMDYITIASTGNATDFGDLTVGRYNLSGCSGNGYRGVFGGGDGSGGRTDDQVMDYITIASTGNATDFGDLNYYSVTHGLAAVAGD